MEDIYEFQTARICEPEQWNVYIKEVINNLRKNSKIIAKPIPILPSVVTMEHVKEALKDLTAVPIGINEKTLDIYTYNFRRDLVNIISTKNIDIAVQFISHLIEEIKQLNNVEVVVLDAENILEKGKMNVNYKNFILGMQNNINSEKNVICVIIGVDKFINDVENAEKGFYEILQIAELLKNYNFIMVENFTKFKSHQYDDWYKAYITGDTGIWIGNGVNDQYLISRNMNYKINMNRSGDSFGYAIIREATTVVKLLGMKEIGEDDE